MALLEVLKSRLSRHKEKRKDIEILVNKSAASPNQKQQYVELKAKEDELENIIDIAEGLIESDDK
ncbi:hypothetical protein [Formosa sp. Hel1_33_131]|uniref:hypothetical protein n=1 Tax=Formosa sp. Hel1_33_131 TaxID=1336794 RepID=UPI0012F8661D|nr:hypothetical protein [Formosa sp. Hel1_33_131]